MTGRHPFSKPNAPQRVLFGLFWALFLWSGIEPFRYTVWLFQMLVPLSLALLLFACRKRYIPSVPTSLLLFIQGSWLLMGAHFSFHRIPWLRVALPSGMERSLSDWLVHFIDGLVYAAVIYDLSAIRTNRVSRWLAQDRRRTPAAAFAVCFILAVGWEIIEWIAYIASRNLFNKNGGVALDTWIDIGLTLLGGMLAIPVLHLRRKTEAPQSE